MRLTALTELQLDGAAVTDALSAELLARLTQLSRLDLHNCPLLTDAGAPGRVRRRVCGGTAAWQARA
jgi:hypothetical protein